MLFAIMAVSTLFVTLSYAQLWNPLQTKPNPNLIIAAEQYAGCKANFTVSVLNFIIADVPGTASNLTLQVTLVQQANSQLQGIASSGNATNFRNYLKNTFDPTLNNATSAAKSALRAAKPGNATISTLRGQYNTSKAALQTCYFGALKAYGNAKLQGYQQILADIRGAAQNASAKVNTSTIFQTIQSANGTAVQPLASAMASANNATQLRAAIGGYCLFDGCPNGVNAHLEANLTIHVFRLGIQKLQQYPNATSQQNITALQGYINNASATLGQVGTNAYTQQQEQSIFGNLKSAAQLAKQILSNFKVHV